MEQSGDKARCLNCRADVFVPDTYAHGDHVKCGGCGTQHRVVRSNGLKLVVADTSPLKDALRQNRQLVQRLEADLRVARASLGMGVNGLGIGLIYLLWQVGQQDRLFEMALFREALAIAIGSGLLLEIANYFFLAKRHAMTRLSADLADAVAEGRLLEKRLRDANRL